MCPGGGRCSTYKVVHQHLSQQHDVGMPADTDRVQRTSNQHPIHTGSGTCRSPCQARGPGLLRALQLGHANGRALEVAQRLHDQLGQVVDVQVVQVCRLARAQPHPAAPVLVTSRLALADHFMKALWHTHTVPKGRTTNIQLWRWVTTGGSAVAFKDTSTDRTRAGAFGACMTWEGTHLMGPAPGVRRLRETSTGMGRLFSTTSGALTTRSHPAQRQCQTSPLEYEKSGWLQQHDRPGVF